jgi:phosphatidylserine/phosphatidylglycerophosphate/cardiolipin synthase-like enzyme
MANYGRRKFVGGIAPPRKLRGIEQNSVQLITKEARAMRARLNALEAATRAPFITKNQPAPTRKLGYFPGSCDRLIFAAGQFADKQSQRAFAATKRIPGESSRMRRLSPRAQSTTHVR